MLLLEQNFYKKDRHFLPVPNITFYRIVTQGMVLIHALKKLRESFRFSDLSVIKMSRLNSFNDLIVIVLPVTLTDFRRNYRFSTFALKFPYLQ